MSIGAGTAAAVLALRNPDRAAALDAKWQEAGLPGGVALRPFARRFRRHLQNLAQAPDHAFAAGVPRWVQATGPWVEIAPYQGL
ncbi:hypothetical protein [Cribrihabitans neustonicus]|uniref:hypothetical protein n=1 Tax=Cribrihabitans neustonicus TaxID=1429085 RepID=UPI003B5C2016